MSTLTVALLQLQSPGVDPERALADGEQACREAAALGADIALFPELWQIGYALPDDLDEAHRLHKELASDIDGPFVGHFSELAKELDIAIVITYIQRSEASPRNAATLIDRRGHPILTYAKVHTCDFSREASFDPGPSFPVAELETEAGPVRIGIMICYDREFPEAARILMLGGAEIVLVPNACHLDSERIGQFRARAFENMTGMAMANYAAPAPGADDPCSCNGHSVAFSGIVYGEDERALNHMLVEAGEEEGIFLATFDLDALRSYRARETWGDAYRKPRSYEALLEDDPAPEFRHSDSRR